jgi:Protein of unknown function (DUF2911)
MRPESILLTTALLAGSAGELLSQIRASELATISQTVDGTELKLEYSRPRARGRDALFGGEIKWNEVWTPGANWATTFEINRDIKLDGHPVAKGKYSVWLVVRQAGPWTVVLDPRSHLFHMAHPDSAADQIRYPVTPEVGPPTDVLTWSFPEVRINGATMAMQWGTVRVPFRVEVTPTYDVKMTTTQAAPYLGNYAFAWTEGVPGDTAPITMTISFRDSAIVGEWTPELWPGAGQAILIPVKDGWFVPAFLVNGEIYDIDKSMSMEFARRKQGEKLATSFEVRGTGDSLWATGKRKK